MHRGLCIVAGKTGYGKSYLVKQYVALAERIVIIDPMGEYHPPDFKPANRFDVITLDSESALLDLKERFHNAGVTGEIRLILRGDRFELFETAIALSYAAGNLIIVIEEISMYGNNRTMSESLTRIVRFGRHRGVSLLGTTQRYGDVSILIRTNMDMLICFRLASANDEQALADTSFVGPEGALRVGQLDRKQSITFFNM